MQQLTGLDSTFLNIETATTYGHVSGLAIFDPSDTELPATLDDLKALITERIHLLPPYRRRLAEVPFGLDHPYWIEDPDFDLDFHVREIALPAPGDRLQLAEQVGRLVSRPLDRRRPLWELYVINGLEHGYVAQVTKIHHCAIDGVSGAEILANLLDLEPTPRVVDPPATPWMPDDVPSDLEMLAKGLRSIASTPGKAIRLGADVTSNLPAVAKSMGITLPRLFRLGRPEPQEDGPSALLSQAATKAPPVSFNALIGPHRRFAYTSIPIERAKTIRRAFGVTLNDVVMALCSSALRRYLIERDELPTDPLIAMVPVSVRTEGQQGQFGNQGRQHDGIAAHPDQRPGRTPDAASTSRCGSRRRCTRPCRRRCSRTSPSSPSGRGRSGGEGDHQRGLRARWVDLPYNVVISMCPDRSSRCTGRGHGWLPTTRSRRSRTARG